jgi:hypothetical protein
MTGVDESDHAAQPPLVNGSSRVPSGTGGK